MMALKPTLAGYPSAMWADTELSALVLVPLAEKILTGLSACFSLMSNLARPSPVLEVPSKSRWGAHAKRGRRQQQWRKRTRGSACMQGPRGMERTREHVRSTRIHPSIHGTYICENHVGERH
ncbi:hypothetical protein B0T13DRAFT_128057 [Neurospora crassa]|nr:hypothetical protein B0T13DRAFT_128057 [Neurospora crassa]